MKNSTPSSGTSSKPIPELIYGVNAPFTARQLSLEEKDQLQLDLLHAIEKCCFHKATGSWCNKCVERVLRSRWLAASAIEDRQMARMVAMVFDKRIYPLLAVKSPTSSEAHEVVEYFNACTLYVVGCIKESIDKWVATSSLGKDTSLQ